MDDHAIDAIPGAVLGHERQAPAGPYHLSRVATASYLMHPLPDENIMALLLEDYFDTVHWFSLVIFEAKFRPAFDAVRTGLASPAEKPFLLLLSTMLGLAAWYRGHVSQNEDEHPPEFWQGWSERMIANSESQIIDLMDQSSITAIQILILLGSYYVYHGRPNLSFSLLGATVKAAQAAGLHREPIHASKADAEQQKRVWWTIYTWDRFVYTSLAFTSRLERTNPVVASLPSPTDGLWASVTKTVISASRRMCSSTQSFGDYQALARASRYASLPTNAN